MLIVLLPLFIALFNWLVRICFFEFSLFSGTTATLSREVPFYMFGIVFYQILKKAFRGELYGQEGRDLMPWETLMVGALSGALGAIVTTPADVMKTRIMTAPVGSKISASQILIDILKAEGLPALFKGEKIAF